MNPETMSVEALLPRIESEFETADGRHVRLCRDADGGYWVVDGAGRSAPLAEFAADCAGRARSHQARELGALYRRIAAGVRGFFARIGKDAQQAAAKTARA